MGTARNALRPQDYSDLGTAPQRIARARPSGTQRAHSGCPDLGKKAWGVSWA
jgi:hypothetical protein